MIMDFLTVIKSTLISFVSGIVRTLIVSGVSWLAARDLVDDSTSHQLIAWIPIVIAGIAWSLVEKFILARFHLDQLLTALALPPGTTHAELQEIVKEQKAQKKAQKDTTDE